MRKLVAAIAFLAVTALPATALAQPHWRRGQEVHQAHSSRRMAHPDATDYANLRRIYAGASHTERPQASPQAI